MIWPPDITDERGNRIFEGDRIICNVETSGETEIMVGSPYGGDPFVDGLGYAEKNGRLIPLVVILPDTIHGKKDNHDKHLIH